MKNGAPISDSEWYGGYAVKVNGRDVPVHACRVSAMSFNTVWPGHQRPLEQTEEAAFVTFDLSEPVTVEVTVNAAVNDAVVRPLSCGIQPVVDGNKVSFILEAVGPYSLEINGRHNSLHLFVNAPETEEEKKAGAAATYAFGPGYHKVGLIKLQSGESVYLADGAVVNAEIVANDAENVRIFGRGIMDTSIYKRPPVEPTEGFEIYGMIIMERCRNVKIEGIILRDSPMWTITTTNCVGVEYDNVKVIGQWRYNTDGFDFVNCQNVHVNHCFLRTFDDGIVIKGLYTGENGVVEKMNNLHYLVENNVVWCDWGGALEVGAETVCDEYEDILYRNIDIVRNDSGAMRLHSGDRAHLHNIRYEDIRVEYSKYDRRNVYQQSDDMVYEPGDTPTNPAVINNWMYCNTWSPYGILGHIDDIHYKNIRVYADPEVPALYNTLRGADADHLCQDITIENFVVNGEKQVPTVMMNDFTKNVVIK